MSVVVGNPARWCLDDAIVIIANILDKNIQGVSEGALILHCVQERGMARERVQDAIHWLESLGCVYFIQGRIHLG